ncbi:MAG: DsbA family protein [Patescibacteria group bacterium]
MKINIKKLKDIIIPVIVIIIIVGVVFGWYYLSKKSKSILKPQVAAEKAINFINQTYLKGQATAVLGQVSEERGVYKIQFKIEDQEYTAYATKDGKLLFPSGVEMPDNVTAPTTGSDIPKKDSVLAQLFVMSFCPYGNQAEEIMKDVVGVLKDKAGIELHYVIYSNYQGGGSNYCLDKENKYCSMHGIQELRQDIREFCVQKYQKDKFWDFLKEINAKCNSTNADTCWESVAKGMGIDVSKVKDCQKNEALTILEQELQLNEKYGIQGSPQLVINDKEYKGSRSAEAYKTAICSGFNSPPSECSQTLQSTGGASSSGGCQ